MQGTARVTTGCTYCRMHESSHCACSSCTFTFDDQKCVRIKLQNLAPPATVFPVPSTRQLKELGKIGKTSSRQNNRGEKTAPHSFSGSSCLFAALESVRMTRIMRPPPSHALYVSVTVRSQFSPASDDILPALLGCFVDGSLVLPVLSFHHWYAIRPPSARSSDSVIS